MTKTKRRILVVEDDADIARLLEMHLRDLGCDVAIARDGDVGLNRALQNNLDLIVLDRNLPEVDGLDICRQVREQMREYIPILMLTCRSSEADRVSGLESGADDYMVKPFSVNEFVARVKAIFRRTEALQAAPAEARVIRMGGLVVECEKRKAVLDGAPLSLTVKEFDLLELFASHPGQVFTRLDLLRTVWGEGYEGYEHTVNTHINRLRTKLEADTANPKYLLTVWGIGYRFAEAADL